MELTSGEFVWGSIAVAVLLIVALTVLWPRLGGRQWWLYPVRALALVLVVALSLVGAGSYLNRQNYWYASWKDLLDPSLAQEQSALGAKVASAADDDAQPWGAARLATAEVKEEKKPPALHLTEQPVGATASAQVPGVVSGHTGRVLVWLPPGYTEDAAKGKTFPVVVAFHGFPGKPENVLKELDMANVVNRRVVGGQMAAPVVLIPDLTPNGVDTECVDSKQLRMDTWLAQDLPAWAAANLSVRQERTSWMTVGYSAGAYCSAMIAMRHPDVFAAGVSMSGYFHPMFSAGYRPFGPGSGDYARYDMIAVARKSPPKVALWVVSSPADALMWPDQQKFLKAVRPPTAVVSTVLQNAGHRWSVWGKLIGDSFIWAGQNVPGFKPTSGSTASSTTGHAAGTSSPGHSAEPTATSSTSSASTSRAKTLVPAVVPALPVTVAGGG